MSNLIFALVLAALLRLMPVGDSNTIGFGELVDGAYGGYRARLVGLLDQSGVAFRMVGSQNDGPPWMDERAHEGHQGFTTAQVRDDIDSWMVTSRPNVVLLLSGVADATTNADPTHSADRLGEILDRIEMRRPGALVIVSTVPHVGPPGALVGGVENQRLDAYNAALPGVVSGRAAAGYRVVLIDAASVIGQDMLYDGTHFNRRGQNYLALLYWKVLIESREGL